MATKSDTLVMLRKTEFPPEILQALRRFDGQLWRFINGCAGIPLNDEQRDALEGISSEIHQLTG